MKGRVTALMIVILMLVPAAVLVLSIDEAEAAPETVHFKGVVKYDGKTVEDADICLMWQQIVPGDTSPIKGIESGSGSIVNGEFDVTITGVYYPDASHTISISCVYGANNLPLTGPWMDVPEPKGGIVELPAPYVFDLPDVNITGSVEYGGSGVEGATVSLIQNGKSVSSVVTSNDGVFELGFKPGNKYSILVERGGFIDFETNAQEYTTSVNIPVITLQLAPETVYWGFDMPHLFSLIGLTAAFVLLGVVLLYVFWMKRHPESLIMIGDSLDDEE